MPDLAKGDGAICPPTAQHAMRQGKVLADNLIASLRGLPLQDYVHKDLGLVVDLGGKDAVSKPLGIELRGLPAQAVARGYHWSALRTNVAKTRVMTNWMLNAVAARRLRTDRVPVAQATLRDFEYTDAYLTPEQVRGAHGGGGHQALSRRRPFHEPAPVARGGLMAAGTGPSPRCRPPARSCPPGSAGRGRSGG